MHARCSFFTDGKPWKMAQPGHCDAADALVRAAGGDDVNVLQADGICYSFTCPLHCHDAMVFQETSMLTMLSVLCINNDPL